MIEWPATNLPGPAVALLVALAGVLLYVFAWRSVRELPLAGRIFARLVLALVILLPFGLLIWTTADRQKETSAAPPPRPGVEAPSPRDGTTTGGGQLETAEKEARARERVERERAEDASRREEERQRQERQAAEDSRKKAGEAKPKAAKPDADRGSETGRSTRGLSPSAPGAPGPSGGEAPPVTSAEAPPPPTPPPAPAPAAPPPPPAAAPKEPPVAVDDAKQADWDVVPVFFGTDRAQAPDPKRLQFSWERGRKLTLGRALVTVPRAHQVPVVERPWVVKIPYFEVTIYAEAEDPKKHFTMKELKALSKEEMLALVRERLAASARFKDHALIFVHGYNTTFDNAVYRTAQIAYDLKFDSAPFLYSWPSGGQVASYTYDRESAGQAEPYLKQFLETVVKETGAKSVSVIAHSMGNQPLLQVLKDLKLQAPAGVTINQVISAAPDVDRDSFENIARTIQGFAKGVTLYAASNDRALIVSRRFHGGVPRAGDVPEQGPVVLPGVDTIDVSAASMDGLGINHSGYAENNALLSDIALLIQTGERPPDKRVPILERVKTGRGDYWRYPPSR